MSEEEKQIHLYMHSKNEWGLATLCVEKDKEIERLNNIINEFDKWLLGEQMMFYKGSDDERLIRYGETKNKWLELKGVELTENDKK